MSEARREFGRAATALALSVATHLSLTLLGQSSDRASEMRASAAPSSTEVAIELPEMVHDQAGGTGLPRAGARGGEHLPRPDSDRAGRGGEPEVDQAAVNLAPRDDEAHLAPELRSHLDRAQEARTRSGEVRRSPEDDRVSLRPMMLTFVSEGPGSLPRLTGPRAVRDRGEHEVEEQPRARPELPSGGEREAAAGERAAGDGQGTRMRALARVEGLAGAPAALSSPARPLTVVGGEASPADERGQSEDTVDAEQQVSALDPSPLRASTAGGAEGRGRGGSEGGGAPGAGGNSGPGSRGHVQGSGAGPGFGIDPADARRRSYLRSMTMRIHRSWSASDFPREAVLEGRQGHTIVSFNVLADGSVSDVRITRPSGFPAFDRKMVRAVLRAAPFGRLPPELGPVLRRSHDFVVSNPAVRPVNRR